MGYEVQLISAYMLENKWVTINGILRRMMTACQSTVIGGSVQVKSESSSIRDEWRA